MIDAYRDCPGCGAPREFAQLHPEPERCPDVAGGRCPEWFCTDCGASLLLELLPSRLGQRADLGQVA